VYAEEEAELLTEAAESPAGLDALVARRVAGEPLEYVVGWAAFAGLRIIVEPGVFVPRRRTEALAREAAILLTPDSVVVDLCCGSGAIAAVLAGAGAGEVYAADIDPVAVACARRNLAPSGWSSSEEPATPGWSSSEERAPSGWSSSEERASSRPLCLEGDLYDALPKTLAGRIDILVANVPYVPTDEIALMPPEARDHEPAATLDGGADGLDQLRRVAADAPRWLAPGGSLLSETSERQAPYALEILAAAGLTARTVTDDDLGATVAIGRRSPTAG
jgi:release factor glutamine methyltransferase